MNKYDDMINLSHWNPKNHPRMSMTNRSAQFAPFAALTGYKEEIIETSRFVDRMIELNDDEKNFINQKLCLIQENIKNHPFVSITYFIPDKLKKGGSYETLKCNIQKIDLDNKMIITSDKTKILINNIFDIKILN